MTTRKDDPRLNTPAYSPPFVDDLARTEQGGGGETVNQADADAARGRMVDPPTVDPNTPPKLALNYVMAHGRSGVQDSPTLDDLVRARMVDTLPPAADTPPVPEPTQGEITIKLLLALGMPVAYLGILVMLHVYWLSFGHHDLQSICLIGDGIFASATATVAGHYLGTTTSASALNTGVGLMPAPRRE